MISIIINSKLLRLQRSIMNLFLILAFLVGGSMTLNAQFTLPCDDPCTGTWSTVNYKTYPYSSFCTNPPPEECQCSVKVYYYEREAQCSGGIEETQFYISSIHLIDCDPDCCDLDDVRQHGVTQLFYDFILNTPCSTTTYVKGLMQGCWSYDLLGPHPVAQPCPNSLCCKYRYTVVKDEFCNTIDVQYEYTNPNGTCDPYGGATCNPICNPNGYYSKQAEYFGIDVAGLSNSSIFPNPNHGSFTFSLNTDTNGKHKLFILNLRGNEIQKIEFDKTSDEFIQKVNLKTIMPGTYFYFIEFDNKRISAGKISIE